MLITHNINLQTEHVSKLRLKPTCLNNQNKEKGDKINSGCTGTQNIYHEVYKSELAIHSVKMKVKFTLKNENSNFICHNSNHK